LKASHQAALEITVLEKVQAGDAQPLNVVSSDLNMLSAPSITRPSGDKAAGN